MPHRCQISLMPERSRRKLWRFGVAWVLIAGFLLQPVLTYLVTPMVSHDNQGRSVVLCTLKGQKRVVIDLPPSFHDAQNQLDNEHCTALKLFQMASATQLPPPVAAPLALLYSVTVVDQTADEAHRSLHFSAYSSRAPPHLS